MFNPIAGPYWNSNISKAYETNEKEKKQSYYERILEIENRSFTPIVFSDMGGIGKEGKTFHKRLSEMIDPRKKKTTSIHYYILDSKKDLLQFE